MQAETKKYPPQTHFVYELERDGTYTIYSKNRDTPWQKNFVKSGVRGCNVNRTICALENQVASYATE